MGTGAGSGSSVKSYRDKVNEISSSLVKVASNGMDGLRAVFAELKAKDDKVIASLPGRSDKQVSNNSINNIARDFLKFSDILKIAIGVALTLITGNPIPLLLAERHAKNLQERIKAKQKAVLKEAKKNKIKNTMASKSRLNKNDAEYRQLKSLESKIKAKEKEANLAIKRVEMKSSINLNEIDKGIINIVQKSFVRLGYKSSDAKKAALIALKNTNERDVKTVLKLALKEVAALQSTK